MNEEYFFKIVIPNYNNAEWLDKCLTSILKQTFKDYKIIVVDDNSCDNSCDIIRKYEDVLLIPMKRKVYNGGARNIGIMYPIKSKYTLFLDSDDWYDGKDVLENIHDVIVANNYPDCVSLSYSCLIGNNKSYQSLMRNSIEDLVSSLYVACWTKCIKSKLVVEFPENTLMEDVVQHIAQCDNLENVVSIDKSCIVWNRNNLNSCSRVENQDCQKGKWQSSMYRYCADLMDLECSKECCEEHRKWRLGIVLNNIKDGKYIQ